MFHSKFHCDYCVRCLGSLLCTPCELGTYQDQYGSSQCNPCKNGTYADKVGSQALIMILWLVFTLKKTTLVLSVKYVLTKTDTLIKKISSVRDAHHLSESQGF